MRQEDIMFRGLAVAVLGVVLVFSMSTPAFASYPGKNGLIAFDRASQIYTISPSGSGLRKLTSSGKNYAPVWNPAGTKIAYEHVTATGAHDIWMMAANGSGKRQWTDNGTTLGTPAWSPNGKTLLLTIANLPSGGGYQYGWLETTSATKPLQSLHALYGYNQDDGDGYTRITGFDPAWASGDIAFASYPIDFAPDGDTCAGPPEGSSDMGANCVDVYDTSTRNFSMPPSFDWATQCPTAGGGGDRAAVDWPRWSPDESNLIYQYQKWDFTSENCAVLPWKVAGAFNNNVISQPGDQEADYSPNGSFIVLVNVLPGQKAHIIIESKIGTNRRVLTQGYTPNWQPVP